MPDLARVDPEVHLLLSHLLREQVPHAVEDRAQIRRHEFQLDLTALDPAHLQDVIDEREQVAARIVDLAKEAAHLLRRVFLHRQIRVADDRVHRRPDVVGHIEEELALRQRALHGADLVPLELLILLPHDVLHEEHDGEAHEDDEQHEEAAEGDLPFRFIEAFRRHQLLSDPHDGRIEQQREENHAGGGHAAVLREIALRDRPEVKQEAEKAPQRQQEECLAAHGLECRNPRHDLHDAEDDRDDESYGAGRRHAFYALCPADLARRRRGVAEGDDRAEARQVHEPVQRVPAEQGEQDRKCHDKDDADRCLRKCLGQDSVLRHRRQDAHRRAVPADDAGHNRGHGGHRHDDDARRAEQRLCRIEGGHGDHPGEVAKVPDIGLPGAVSLRKRGYGDERHEGVRTSRQHDRNREKLSALFGRELEIRRIKGHHLKADEGPGGEDHDAEYAIGRMELHSAEGP